MAARLSTRWWAGSKPARVSSRTSNRASSSESSAIRTCRGTRTDWLRSERATPGHMPCGRRQSNTFLLGEVALRAIAPSRLDGVDPAGQADHVISDYAFLNWGAHATDQGVLPS